MIERKVYIERYDWTLCAYYAVTDYHTEHILTDLQRIDCPEELQQRVEGNLRRKTMDSGFTYSNKRLRETVMVIGLHSSPPEFLNSFEHELRHLIDDICSATGIRHEGEEVAYLTGDINGLLAMDVAMFLCDCHCGKERMRKELKVLE